MSLTTYAEASFIFDPLKLEKTSCMNNFKPKLYPIKFHVLLLFFILSVNSNAQTFKPFQKLYVIKTKKFDIIYSEKTRQTALRLSIIADNIYEKNSKLIDKEVKGRIPVTLTADNRIVNAYAFPVSKPHIVIYVATQNIKHTTFENSLEAIFLHELMHLLTLSSTDTVLTKIFGPWFSFVNISGSYFMTEGVTVSYESIGGFGRANDPFVKQTIREDIRENKFKTPIQVSDVWDQYPYMNVVYEYGGLFSKYIQDEYGMEKYAAFWDSMQKRWHISLNFYNAGLYNAFKKIYGITFLEAWSDFKNSLTITNVVRNKNTPITKNPSIIGDIKTFSNNVYFIDNNAAILNVYNTLSGQTKKISSLPKSANSISLNENESKVLIGYNHYSASFGTPIIKEYDINKKRYTKLILKDAKEASYFRSGVVYIASDVDRNYLAYFHNGANEKLLYPEYDVFYYSPSPIDENKIALIVSEKGVRFLGIYDYEKKSLSKIKTPLRNDKDVWRYIRSLSYNDGKLLFAYNDNDEFYKLGILDLNTKTIVLTKTNYEGAVINPALSGEKIYYKAMFTDYQALMLYPENIYEVDGNRTSFSEEIVPDLTDASNKDAFYLTEGIKEEKYFGIKYINPLKMWLPFPLFSEGSPYFFTGLGIFTMFTDAIDHNVFIFFTGYDAVSKFADLDLSWYNYSFQYPLQIKYTDKIIYTSFIRYRKSKISLSFSPYFEIDGKSRFLVSPTISSVFMFYENKEIKTGVTYDLNDRSKSAYTWNYTSYSININANIAYIYLNKSLNPFLYDEVNLSFIPTYSINANKYRLDSIFYGRTRYIPFTLTLKAAYSDDMIDYDGYSKNMSFYSISLHPEYFLHAKKNRLFDNKILAGEIETIYGLEVNANISYLYINRVYGALSYRNSFYDNKYLNSIALKIGTETHIPITFSIPIKFEFTAALMLPPNMNNRNDYLSIDNWYLGFTVKSSLTDFYI